MKQKMSFIFLWSVKHNTIRQKLISQINDTFDTSNFSHLDYFINIIGAKDFDTIKIIATFVVSPFDIRSQVM
jgi:hypothetical protein